MADQVGKELLPVIPENGRTKDVQGQSRLDQLFSSPKFFLVVLLYIAGTQGSFFNYFLGVASTLEKRFSYSSSVTSLFLMVESFTVFIVAPICAMLSSKVNKAKIVSMGVFMIATSSIGIGGLFFIFGPRDYSTDTAELNRYSTGNSSRTFSMCQKEVEGDKVNCEDNDLTNWTAVIMIFVILVFEGAGYYFFFLVGYPYADDLLPKKQTPIYFAFISVLRLIGPSIGILLSSVIIRIPEDMFNPDAIRDNKDPKFIGAWWLGSIMTGVITLVGAIPMFFFSPDLLKKKKPKITDEFLTKDEQNRTILSFEQVKMKVRRLLTNKLWMFDQMAANCAFFAIAGYYIAQPKYIESQYHKSAADASFFTGTSSLLSQAAGILLGGLIVRILKPQAKAMTIFTALVEVALFSGLLAGWFFGCPGSAFHGYNKMDDGQVTNPDQNIFASCNADCSCTRTALESVCSSDNVTNYFSPCFAGCKSIQSINGSIFFSNCGCEPSPQITLKSGYCPLDCNNFIYYIGFMSIGKLIGSTGRVAGVMIKFRSVEPEDKAFSMALAMLVSSIISGIPFKYVYGKIMDASCMIWQQKDVSSSCASFLIPAKKGNCWLYDSEKFRVYLHGVTLCILTLSVIFDLMVICQSHHMKEMYKDDDFEEVTNNEKEDEKKLESKM